MNIITKPNVEVVGLPKFTGHSSYKVPSDGDDVTRLGAFAAKSCYKSFSEDGRSCVENQRSILQHKHGSVAEHLNINLYIEGITRALSLELNRHRHMAISQQSTRYVNEEDASIVLEPYLAHLYNIHKDQRNDLEQELLVSHIRSSRDAIREYKYQVNLLMELNPFDLEGFDLRKWARGKARNILPHNLETSGVWTMNVRGLRWFLEARSSEHALDEIRRLSYYVYEKVKGVAPIYFDDFNEEGFVGDYGYPKLTPEHSKV